MGNYVSCVAPNFWPKTAKVILCNGSIQEFQKPVKAAELMLENSQQFVSHYNSLQVGRRVSALSADEDLELGNLYFMLPMEKLNTALSASEMDSLLQKASAVAKRGCKSTARILPVLAYVRPLLLSAEKKQENLNAGSCLVVMGSKPGEVREEEVVIPRMDIRDVRMELEMYKTSSCRSWKPTLETISEISR